MLQKPAHPLQVEKEAAKKRKQNMEQDNIQQDTQNTNEKQEYATLEEAIFDTPL